MVERARPRCGPGEVVCRIARVRDLRLRRARLVRGAQAARGARPRAGRRGRGGRRRASRASRRATAWQSTTTRPCGALPRLRRRPRDALRAVPGDAPRSRRLRRVRAHRGGAGRASCCRSTAWTRSPRPAPSRSPARCAAQDRVGARAARHAARGRRGRERAAARRRRPGARRRATVLRGRARRGPSRAGAARGAPRLTGRDHRVDVAVVMLAHDRTAIAAAAAALGPGGRLCVYAPPRAGRADRGRRRRRCSCAS